MNPLRQRQSPLLLEIPVRPWLAHYSTRVGRPVSLDEIPEDALDGIASGGFDAVWLMGMWTTGPKARRLALEHPELRATYDRLLPGWQADDVGGSPYSIAAYEPFAKAGGREGLRRFRERLNERGVALVLDFVPNHLGVDHPWLDEQPDLLVRGTPELLAGEPSNWFRHPTQDGSQRIFAHGRDPHFAGWSDTVQVDYRRRETRAAMTELLLELGSVADGLRCDVAMLVLEDVFRNTWGDDFPAEAGDFWSGAIPTVRERFPDIALIAEAYWGLEDRLCELGFDWAYDKDLYDRLVRGEPAVLREAFARDRFHHARRVHFLENHDEERAWHTFGPERSAAAAVALYALPGLRFFQIGQGDGHLVRPPVQLARYPDEAAVPECRKLYDALLRCLGEIALHDGRWEPLTFEEVAPGSAAGLVGCRWTGPKEVWLATANFGAERGRARVPLPVAPEGVPLRIVDELTGEHFERNRRELLEHGLYTELPPGGAHVFRCPCDPAAQPAAPHEGRAARGAS